MLREKQDAEDNVQDVFLKLNRLETSGIENIEAYAVRITKNLCLDKLKAKKHITSNIDIEELRNASPSVEKQMEYKEKLGFTKLALKKLPEQQQAVIELRHIELYTTTEISNILELEENYVRVILSRARKQLTKELEMIYR